MNLENTLTKFTDYLPADLSQNVSNGERGVSLAGGLLLGAWAIKRQAPLMGLVAGGLLFRGLTGHCYTYDLLGWDTAERNDATSVPAQAGLKYERSVLINRPRHEVYAFWRHLENLPRFMHNLERVMENRAGVSHWVAKAPAGMDVEWDAEVITEREPEMISWRSLPGSEIDTAGSVHFNAVGDSTEVVVSMKVNPPAGKIGLAVAKIFGSDPGRELKEDLCRLKETLESNAAAFVGNQASLA